MPRYVPNLLKDFSLLVLNGGNACALSACPKIGATMGRIERGLVVMGCVVDVRYRGISQY